MESRDLTLLPALDAMLPAAVDLHGPGHARGASHGVGGAGSRIDVPFASAAPLESATRGFISVGLRAGWTLTPNVQLTVGAEAKRAGQSPVSSPLMDHPARSTLGTVRRLLLGVLCLACVGTIAELWLMGHYEDWWQWTPLAVMAVCVLAAAWVLGTWSPAAVRALRMLMLALMVTGLTGSFLHYQANMEFQLEMDPSLGGLPLMTKILHAKTPPSLAPGNMVMMGLIGLVAVWRWKGNSDD